jgi:ABC-2 type transport system permease protein
MTTSELRTSARVRATAVRAGFFQVLMAEWTKFASLRTNIWTLIGAAVVSIGVGAVFVFAHLDFWSGMSAAERSLVDPVQESFIGFAVFGLLGFAVIGALAMTAEYSSGTISATFAAMPRRLLVLGAKALVVGVVTLGIATITAFASFLVAQPILARESLDVTLSESDVLFAVIGGGLYSTGAALIGLALGALLRRTASTLVAVTVVFSLAAIIAQAQPESWSTYTKYLPHSAGLALISSIEHPGLLSPMAGLIVLTGWAALGLIVAAVLLERRDVES